MKTAPLAVAAAAAFALCACAPMAQAPGAAGPPAPGATAPAAAAPAPATSTPATSTPAASIPAASIPAAPRIRIYQEPRFVGGGGSMTPALDQLRAIVDAHPKVFSSSWFNPANTRQLVIGVVLPKDPAAIQLEARRRELDPEQKTTKTVPAKYSWADMLQMQRWVLVHYMQQPEYSIQAVGPDPIGQALQVTIYRTATDPPLEQNAAVIALAEKYGDAVEFAESNSLIAAVTG